MQLYFIWSWRCNAIFRKDFHLPVKPHEHTMDYLIQWHQANFPQPKIRTCVIRHIGWQAPLNGAIKINVDGSCDKNRRIAAGGVIRDFEAN